jgi:hypothetical protein
MKRTYTTRRAIAASTLLSALAFAALALPPARAPAQASGPEADPGTVAAALAAAVNAGDADAALALFADDAVVTLLPPAAPGAKSVYTGRAEIGEWLRLLGAQHFRVEEGPPEITGDRVTAIDRIAEDGLRALGVAPLESRKEVVVQRGRITAFTNTLTPASVARLQAAVAGAGGPPPTLPRAGRAAGAAGAAGSARGVAIVAGLALITGLILGRRRGTPPRLTVTRGTLDGAAAPPERPAPGLGSAAPTAPECAAFARPADVRTSA